MITVVVYDQIRHVFWVAELELQLKQRAAETHSFLKNLGKRARWLDKEHFSSLWNCFALRESLLSFEKGFLKERTSNGCDIL